MTLQTSKEEILKCLRHNGKKRIVIARSALSMRVNFPDIKYILNRRPARPLLDQHQQAGRAGRDGFQADVIIVYHGNQLANCEDDVKTFVKAEGCLRIVGYQPFDKNIKSLQPKHNCCSNCANSCDCLTELCSVKLPFDVITNGKENGPICTRNVTTEDKDCILESFQEMKEALPSGCSVFGSTTGHAFSK